MMRSDGVIQNFVSSLRWLKPSGLEKAKGWFLKKASQAPGARTEHSIHLCSCTAFVVLAKVVQQLLCFEVPTPVGLYLVLFWFWYTFSN